MNEDPSLQARPSLLNRLHATLWMSDEKANEPYDILGNESIKHIFDVVKNFALIAALFGTAVFLKRGIGASGWALSSFGYWSILVISCILALLNGFFALNWLSRIPFFINRRYPFFWLLPLMVFVVLVGAIYALVVATQSNNAA